MFHEQFKGVPEELAAKLREQLESTVMRMVRQHKYNVKDPSIQKHAAETALSELAAIFTLADSLKLPPED